MWWKEQWAAILFDWYWLTNRKRLMQLDFFDKRFNPKPFEVFRSAEGYHFKYLISNYYLIIKP